MQSYQAAFNAFPGAVRPPTQVKPVQAPVAEQLSVAEELSQPEPGAPEEQQQQTQQTMKHLPAYKRGKISKKKDAVFDDARICTLLYHLAKDFVPDRSIKFDVAGAGAPRDAVPTAFSFKNTRKTILNGIAKMYEELGENAGISMTDAVIKAHLPTELIGLGNAMQCKRGESESTVESIKQFILDHFRDKSYIGEEVRPANIEEKIKSDFLSEYNAKFHPVPKGKENEKERAEALKYTIKRFDPDSYEFKHTPIDKIILRKEMNKFKLSLKAMEEITKASDPMEVFRSYVKDAYSDKPHIIEESLLGKWCKAQANDEIDRLHDEFVNFKAENQEYYHKTLRGFYDAADRSKELIQALHSSAHYVRLLKDVKGIYTISNPFYNPNIKGDHRNITAEVIEQYRSKPLEEFMKDMFPIVGDKEVPKVHHTDRANGSGTKSWNTIISHLAELGRETLINVELPSDNCFAIIGAYVYNRLVDVFRDRKMATVMINFSK